MLMTAVMTVIPGMPLFPHSHLQSTSKAFRFPHFRPISGSAGSVHPTPSPPSTPITGSIWASNPTLRACAPISKGNERQHCPNQRPPAAQIFNSCWRRKALALQPPSTPTICVAMVGKHFTLVLPLSNNALSTPHSATPDRHFIQYIIL